MYTAEMECASEQLSMVMEGRRSYAAKDERAKRMRRIIENILALQYSYPY